MRTVSRHHLDAILYEEGADVDLPPARLAPAKQQTSDLLRFRDKPVPYKPSSPRLAHMSVRHTGPLSLA